METNGKCMGFKAEIESGHLRNFENSSNIANPLCIFWLINTKKPDFNH